MHTFITGVTDSSQRPGMAKLEGSIEIAVDGFTVPIVIVGV